MILREVHFENFGVYGGKQTIVLTPRGDDVYNRPIILFHGKNGVGKTSFVEAIRIAIHGSLALGDRVSQRAYQEHLKRRIHRPANPNAHRPTSSQITVWFDWVRESRTVQYQVSRSWHLTGNGLVEQLQVWEDDNPPENILPENYDYFLRDLISPTTSELYFFDGEKLDSFSDDAQADATLAEAMQRLLGLHLVQQLETDLDVYIGRAASQMGQQELQVFQEENEGMLTAVADLKLELADLEQQIRDSYAAIARQEQELADKGGIYAKEYPRLQKERLKMKQEIELYKRRLQEAASSLLPIAAAPKMAERLLSRLDLEAKQQQQQLVAQILNGRRDELIRRIRRTNFGTQDGGDLISTAQQSELIEIISDVLNPEDTPLINDNEVFIQVSARDRSSMIGQIKEALEITPLSFHDAAQRLSTNESELDKIEQELKMAPSDFILQPIFDVIQLLEKQVIQLKDDQKKVTEQLAMATFKLEQTTSKLKRANESMKESGRVDLAVRAQRAIRAYAQKLRLKKVEAFAFNLLKRFNSLCRKEAFLSGLYIDAETFSITLERNGEQFKRTMLSAGEKQLFALSILWALREVAGVPMPVVIDTPLSRLDSDHRQTMLKKFLPEVSHQVILLATDTEIDETALNDLAPSISHGYSMTFDSESGSTHLNSLTTLPVEITKRQQIPSV